MNRFLQELDNFTAAYDPTESATPQSLWILGREYIYRRDEEEIKNDIRSRVWITYRRGFPRIGGSGPTSDYGWGCMLRCGQMVLAQALVTKHLGRDWRWSSKEDLIACGSYRDYLKIISLFLDQKGAPYSIHQIAQMGASEGKPVGNWFGPNTVAQALKKLAEYDKWNRFVIHVSLDNLVIIDDIKSYKYSHNFQFNDHSNGSSHISQSSNGEDNSSQEGEWPGILLFIPLRLGLSELNPLYHDCLKRSFRIKTSLGIIGGRPNHALYFIGYADDELVYLDPHFTQPAIDCDLENLLKRPEMALESIVFDDSSYHQDTIYRMPMDQLDPSISLCFYFSTESEFDSWCIEAQELLVNNNQPLFELFKERPFHFKTLHIVGDSRNPLSEYDTGNITPEHLNSNLLVTGKEIYVHDSSDDEFEILTTDS